MAPVAPALAPQFTDTFTVPKGNYGDFIRLVRQNVSFHCSNRGPNHLLVLPPEQKDDPKLWFHVVLRTQDNSLPLAIRLDNLYLVGFKTKAGVWWEFNNNDKAGKHLIPDSRWLGFDGSYAGLIGHHQKAGLHAVTLGRAEMAAAVDALAVHGEGQGAQAADAYALPKSKLVKLVMMLCEGVRFHTLYRTVEKEFDHPAATVSEIEGMQVREWDKISRAMLKWAVDPKAKIDDMEKIHVKDINAAIRIVAIVKDDNTA